MDPILTLISSILKLLYPNDSMPFQNYFGIKYCKDLFIFKKKSHTQKKSAFPHMSWKIKKGKMSHCELMEEDFPFKSSMTSSEVERSSFNCNWLCTLASNGLQMAIEVFLSSEAAEAVVLASPKSLAASTTRWWKTRQDSPISRQPVRFSN